PIIDTKDIDLAMLDIKIKGKESGIDIGHHLNQTYDLPFIYVTSFFDERIVRQAEETDPGAYLVKPFKESDIKASIQLTLGKRRNKFELRSSPIQPLNLFIKREGVLSPVDPSDILYIVASDNYSEIFTQQGKIVVSKTLKVLEESFCEAGFSRIHKTFFVNISKIDSIDHNQVYVQGKGMPIGRAFKKAFFEKLTII
ncbi:MAG: response regulator transcription factor, partial [Bacteroidota bacterium]